MDEKFDGLASKRVGFGGGAVRVGEEAVAHWRLHLRNANETWAGAGEGERVVDSLGG